MSDSRVPAAIDAILALLRDPTSGVSTGTDVVDGPMVSGNPAPKRVYVGYDGDPDGGFGAATSDQDWAGLGARKRDETFTITCAALAINGAGNIKQARDDAYAVLAEVSSILRANVSLGFPPPTVAAIRNPVLHQYPTDAGVEALVAFEIAVSTRI